MEKPVLASDRYRAARGGYSRLLELRCRECGALLFLYQKDGPGSLRRLYLDRIRAGGATLPSPGVLACPSCGDALGTLYVYGKEGRRAFRLYQDAVTKKVRRA